MSAIYDIQILGKMDDVSYHVVLSFIDTSKRVRNGKTIKYIH